MSCSAMLVEKGQFVHYLSGLSAGPAFFCKQAAPKAQPAGPEQGCLHQYVRALVPSMHSKKGIRWAKTL